MREGKHGQDDVALAAREHALPAVSALRERAVRQDHGAGAARRAGREEQHARCAVKRGCFRGELLQDRLRGGARHGRAREQEIPPREDVREDPDDGARIALREDEVRRADDAVRPEPGGSALDFSEQRGVGQGRQSAVALIQERSAASIAEGVCDLPETGEMLRAHKSSLQGNSCLFVSRTHKISTLLVPFMVLF